MVISKMDQGQQNLIHTCRCRYAQKIKPCKFMSKLISGDCPASVAQLDAPSEWRPGGRVFDPCRGRQHSFVEIDHEIFSTVILSLLLIQEGQLSVSGKRMCTIQVNRLEDQACPLKVWLGKLTALDMTLLDWLGRKTSKQTNKPLVIDYYLFNILFI